MSIPNNVHIFNRNGESFLIDGKSSRVFVINPIVEYVLSILKENDWDVAIRELQKLELNNREIEDIKCSIDEIFSWKPDDSENIINSCTYKNRDILSLYLCLHSQEQNTELNINKLRKIMDRIFTKTDPMSVAYLTLDQGNANIVYLRYLLNLIKTYPCRIICSLRIDALNLSESLIPFILNDDIKLIISLVNYFRDKKKETSDTDRVTRTLQYLQKEKRSVAEMSSIFNYSPELLQAHLDEIRHLGFMAFYTTPIATCFANGLDKQNPIVRNNSFNTKRVKYFKIINNATRPYFKYANEMFFQLPNEGKVRCCGGRAHLAISATGEVYPCAALINVPSSSLGKFDEFIRNNYIMEYPLIILKHCRECWAWKFCGGMCPYFLCSENASTQAGYVNVNCQLVHWFVETAISRSYANENKQNTIAKLWYTTLVPYFPQFIIAPKAESDEIVTIRTEGSSMAPRINNDEILRIQYVHPNDVSEGDIIIFERDGVLICHRVIRIAKGVQGTIFLHERGDSSDRGGIISAEEVLGKVIS